MTEAQRMGFVLKNNTDDTIAITKLKNYANKIRTSNGVFDWDNLDHVVFYDKVDLNFEYLLQKRGITSSIFNITSSTIITEAFEEDKGIDDVNQQNREDKEKNDKTKNSVDQTTEMRYGNFILSDGKLYWQKTYTTKLSVSEQIQAVKTLGILENVISESDRDISGITIKFDNDFKGAGFSEMLTPIYIARMNSFGSVIYQFKEGRFRVTFSEIKLRQEYYDSKTKEGTIQELILYAAKRDKSGWRNAFRGDASKILDYTYTKKFDINSGTKILDDDF
jgi:hypothetical protein